MRMVVNEHSDHRQHGKNLLTVHRQVDNVEGFEELDIVLFKVNSVLVVKLCIFVLLLVSEVLASLLEDLLEEHAIFKPLDLTLVLPFSYASVDPDSQLQQRSDRNQRTATAELRCVDSYRWWAGE